MVTGTALAATDCEAFTDGFWGQPVNTVTSGAFVAAGLAIVVAHARCGARVMYGVLAIATGVGSVIAHGPAPAWSEPVHDLPLLALYAFVAADAVADLSTRPDAHNRRGMSWRSAGWWLAPAVLIVAAEQAGMPGTPLEIVVVVAAVGASLLRMRARPGIRRRAGVALALLAFGALVGTLSRTGAPWCAPESLLQGHAVWHLLAALAVWWLAPVIGSRTELTRS